MSITRSMMDIVKEEMESHGLKRLKRLSIKVGDLTAVEPEALRFCFEICTEGTGFEGAKLDIEEVPLTARCSECGKEFRTDACLAPCPCCNGQSVRRISGDELEIVSMEAE